MCQKHQSLWFHISLNNSTKRDWTGSQWAGIWKKDEKQIFVFASRQAKIFERSQGKVKGKFWCVKNIIHFHCKMSECRVIVLNFDCCMIAQISWVVDEIAFQTRWKNIDLFSCTQNKHKFMLLDRLLRHNIKVEQFKMI